MYAKYNDEMIYFVSYTKSRILAGFRIWPGGVNERI